MATESVLVTALPHSAARDDAFHVALFVTHRLEPDGAAGTLADFRTVVDWTTHLAGARITLQGRTSAGTTVDLPCTPLLDALEPALWPRVFPPDLAVRPFAVRDLTAEPWRTFPAHRMQQHALLVHALSVFSSPVAAPSVAGNILTEPLLAALGVRGSQRGRGVSIEDVLTSGFDARATQAYDRITGGERGDLASAGNPLLSLMADLHRARRYYQRPEEQTAYAAGPDPDFVPEPVRRPEPDFHERAGMLGDLSPLLRRLGLVVDLRVDDVAALADVEQLQAALAVDGLDNPITEQPRTACHVTGSAFYATTSSGDYAYGVLRLADDDRFTVLDLDPDASALKLEQYTRNVPRMLAVESNGDRVDSAPGSLRATGFAVARKDRAQLVHDRVEGAAARDAALRAGTAPPLELEQVSRGLRLEVWDDVTTQWHSLHRRRLDVAVDGTPVLEDAPDTGFLQGAALTQADGQPDAPRHAHEVLAGWDGWSLSAPRPGLVLVRTDDGEELHPEAPVDPAPVNPVASTTRVEPGSLPRLRYGRSYSFRAYAVDLAGNSRPHVVAGQGGGAGPRDGAPEQAAEHAAALLGRRFRDATTSPAQPETREALSGLRQSLRGRRPARPQGPVEGRAVGGVDLSGLTFTGTPEVDRLVLSRLATRTQARLRTVTRREQIEASFDTVAQGVDLLMERTDAAQPATALTGALVGAVQDDIGLAELNVDDLVAAIGQLVTPPRPFLRWDPVIEPVAVPRHAYSEGESLLHLVVRSGVAGPEVDGGLDVTLTPPADYAAEMTALHSGLLWRGTSERHLAPPKTSQLEAEMHGRFDAAIGGGSAAQVRAALAAAVRESGTFLDTRIPDLTTPGATVEQTGVALHASPTSEADLSGPADGHVRGMPLLPGQYVVHDVDQVVLPYLPDPLAAGVSLVFPDAGQDHRLSGLLAVEGTTVRYAGDWPQMAPYRLVLEGGSALSALVDGNVVRVTVPPGEQLRLRMSTALDRDALDLLGLWRSLPAALRDNEVLAEAAADGWLWWLTPSVEVVLVHAVPRPVEVPRPTVLFPWRPDHDTAVVLAGAVDVHGPSTERLDVEASWKEWVDDVVKDAPEQVDVKAAVCGISLAPDEDLVVLGKDDEVKNLPDGTALRVHAARHQTGDTRHRSVEYRFRATTRYREYFPPHVTPTLDDLSLLGPARGLEVPSSARPPKAVVRDVLPLFRWEEATEPEQPFALRRSRRAGLRVYLERPWYGSGDGELLAVLLEHRPSVAARDAVSQWASDPVWRQQGPARRAALPLTDVLHATGLDDRRAPERPVGPPVLLPLADVPGTPLAWVLGYAPVFDPLRRLWSVDIALDPGTAFWPFVRLVVARYQPHSNAGLHLSPVTVCDFTQLAPERTATLSRPDDRHARVVVTGAVGVPGGPLPGLSRREPFAANVAATRTVKARLERFEPAVGTDLGWQAVGQLDLPVQGIDGTVVSWAGTLPLPEALPPRRPGGDTQWRVVVEEWERLPGDPWPSGLPGVQSRICYADHLPL